MVESQGTAPEEEIPTKISMRVTYLMTVIIEKIIVIIYEILEVVTTISFPWEKHNVRQVGNNDVDMPTTKVENSQSTENDVGNEAVESCLDGLIGP